MLSEQQAKQLVRDSLAAVNEEKKEGNQIPLGEDTVLLGSGSVLQP